MKKYLLFAAIFGLIVFGFTALARSENSENDSKKLNKAVEKLEKFELPDVESVKENPASLFVGPQGQVRIISGEITAIGTSTPQIDSIKVWGLTLSVDVANAKYIPSGTTASSIKVGDKVNVKGTINKDTGVIKADTVHALTLHQQTINDLTSRIRELIVKIRELQQLAGLPLTPLP